MLRPMTFEDSANAISSPGSAAGRKRSGSLAGQMTLPFGAEAALANPSLPPASEKAPPTNGTCGPSSEGSLRSADLQSRLANKLRARMDVHGSPEFVLTWKSWDMPSGPPICALRARARRPSDSAFGGWPTPVKGDAERGSDAYANREGNMTMVGAAKLAGWTSPRASEIGRQRTPEAIARAKLKGGSAALEDQVQLSSWATTRKTDGEKGIRSTEGAIVEFERKGTGADLPTVAALAATGPTSPSSPAPTANRGVLNPAHSRWLQGYQETWDQCSPSFAQWSLIQKLLVGMLQSRDEIAPGD